jgi:hypothetical protein
MVMSGFKKSASTRATAFAVARRDCSRSRVLSGLYEWRKRTLVHEPFEVVEALVHMRQRRWHVRRVRFARSTDEILVRPKFAARAMATDTAGHQPFVKLAEEPQTQWQSP